MDEFIQQHRSKIIGVISGFDRSFFVVRAKKNRGYRRRICRSIDKTTGLRADQTIMLCGPKTSQQYPIPLRGITLFEKVPILQAFSLIDQQDYESKLCS